MTAEQDPYADYRDDDQPPSDKLDMLNVLAENWHEATEEVAKLAAQLAKAQTRLREIEEKEIPEIMDDIELEKFTTKAGLVIDIKENVRCSIPTAKRAAAFAWLREHGHEKLIKRKLSAQFAMGEEELADRFKNLNLEAMPDLEMDDTETIANPTLVKFVKEKTEAGEELPEDLFPIFRQRVAKIK